MLFGSTSTRSTEIGVNHDNTLATDAKPGHKKNLKLDKDTEANPVQNEAKGGSEEDKARKTMGHRSKVMIGVKVLPCNPKRLPTVGLKTTGRKSRG